MPVEQPLAELGVTIANPNAWASIAIALLVAAGCLSFGVWATRAIGVLAPRAPAGETLGVGLAFGLIVLTAWWAAVASGGRSSFTPVAVAFAIALVAAVGQGIRRRRAVAPPNGAEAPARPEPRLRWLPRRSLAVSAIAAGGFLLVVALLYGSTLTPSPRDGLQPVEKTDVAFYAVLGRDLAATGTEDNTAPAGFDALPGTTPQVWYHWGELWLAAATIKLFGLSPLFARYLVVLPLALLASGAMTGTVVRRFTRTSSRRAFLFGFATCLFLAPVPLLEGPFFSVWASGMIYGITVFGLASVSVLTVMHVFAIERELRPGWPLAVFLGAAIAFVLPAHFIIALLGLVVVGVAVAARIVDAIARGRGVPEPSTIWLQTLIATAVTVLASIAWGSITEHGLGGGGPLARIAPFNGSWQGTIAIVLLGAGILLAPPIAGFLARRDNRLVFDACLGASVMVVLGAILWGWRLATFNSFYLFFGAIAVLLTPVAAIAVWSLIGRLDRGHRRRLLIAVVMACLVQLEFGLVIGLTRLQGQSSPYAAIPVTLLEAIGRLPSGSKLAYGCRSLEEISFVNSKLLGIDAHTGRRVVPMCFEADVNGTLLGAPVSDDVPDAGFSSAPQAAIYPTASARPSAAAVLAFLKSHGIEYVYVDAEHPNSLVPDAVPVATAGDHQVLRIP